jgi:Na+-driven multidrug efflux pump
MVLLALIAKPALAFLYNRPGAPWDFGQAYTPLMLLMPGIFTLSLAKVFTADFFSRGKPQYAMWVSITSLVLNVALNIVLIPRTWSVGSLSIGGMNGAAIASSISYTFSFLMFLYFYIRESGERSRDIFIPKKSDFLMIWAFVRAAWQRVGFSSSIDGEVGP